MEDMGVISKVSNPTEWCAGMVVVPKKSGSVRICVDLKALNDSVLREVHPIPTVDEMPAQLSAIVPKEDEQDSGRFGQSIVPHGRCADIILCSHQSGTRRTYVTSLTVRVFEPIQPRQKQSGKWSHLNRCMNLRRFHGMVNHLGKVLFASSTAQPANARTVECEKHVAMGSTTRACIQRGEGGVIATHGACTV